MSRFSAQGQTAIEFEDEGTVHDSSSTFIENLNLPLHRWYRFSAGFSALWVRRTIQNERVNGKTSVLDPFAGSGTVPLEAEMCGIQGIGVEAHPFVARVAQAKTYWRQDVVAFRRFGLSVLDEAKTIEGVGESYPPLIKKCFYPETLRDLDALRGALGHARMPLPFAELTWLALTSILRDCSFVGTAQWQYVLPNKRKAKTVDPFEAFAGRIELFCRDMRLWQHRAMGPHASVVTEDARQCSSVPDEWADIIITSPPYANNYDYADATRLEMSFFGDVQAWSDLQSAVRCHLIRSCTQHVAAETNGTGFRDDPELEAVLPEFKRTYEALAEEREAHRGRKPYHQMVAAYFTDMAQVWRTLRRVARKGASVYFVVGDSAPYGVHVPVEEWLGRLAVAAGFKSYAFRKIRDRNVKWKNRKHRVPLQEGVLHVEG
jgi:hypothetical protein